MNRFVHASGSSLHNIFVDRFNESRSEYFDDNMLLFVNLGGCMNRDFVPFL